jgi:hypothetical protein
MISKRAYFASCLIQTNGLSGLLCHGGLKEPFDRQPQNQVFFVSDKSAEDLVLTEIQTSNPEKSPSLSHHASVFISGRFYVIIGGWNGRQRTNKIYILDLESREWLNVPSLLRERQAPVGLSSHSASLWTSSERGHEIVIVGREGGVREQRRFGDLFLLKLASDLKTYCYEELPIKGDSRTGHSADLSGKGLFLVGGRKDDPFQLVTWKGFEMRDRAKNQSNGKLRWKLPGGEEATFPGMRFHAMIRISDCPEFIVHGGQHFKSRNSDSNDVWHIALNGSKVTSTKLGDNDDSIRRVSRFGHSLILTQSGQLVVVGGFPSSSKDFIQPIIKLSQ